MWLLEVELHRFPPNEIPQSTLAQKKKKKRNPGKYSFPLSDLCREPDMTKPDKTKLIIGTHIYFIASEVLDSRVKSDMEGALT